MHVLLLGPEGGDARVDLCPSRRARGRAGVRDSTSRGVRKRLDPRPRSPRGGRFPRPRPRRIARCGSPPIAVMRGSRSDPPRLGSAIWDRSRPRRERPAKPDGSGADPRRGIAAANRNPRSRSISRGRAACEVDLVLIPLRRAPSTSLEVARRRVRAFLMARASADVGIEGRPRGRRDPGVPRNDRLRFPGARRRFVGSKG